MESLKISEIVSATNGKLINQLSDCDICYISTSSKDIKNDTLFVPIIGENLDGHKFMMDAYNNGCRNFLIDDDHEFDYSDINLIRVTNTTKALGYIAKYYKNKFNIVSLGITGSVGKTSTKDIIYSVLKEKYNTLKNEGNFNNEIGLPKTLFNLEKNHEFAILEMGMSFKNEIKHLADIVRPNVGIISNIGLSHIENFENQDGIFDAKMEITSYFDKKNILIVNGDDKYLSTLKNSDYPYTILSYGFDSLNDIVCVSYEILDDKIKFVCIYEQEEFICTIPSVAKHNIYNSMAAILVGKLFNIPNELIIKGLENFSITKGRLTVINKRNLTIIDDSYNASSDSMISALNVLRLYKKRRVAVLGDILETGIYDEEIHRNVGKNIKDNCDLLVTVGKSSLYIVDEAIKNGFDCNKIISFESSDDLLDKIDDILNQDDVILLKASHGINLTSVVNYLEEKYEN